MSIHKTQQSTSPPFGQVSQRRLRGPVLARVRRRDRAGARGPRGSYLYFVILCYLMLAYLRNHATLLFSLGIPRILNFLKPKAPALTFLSERGRAASMLMALCHGKCRGGLERSGVLEAPPVPPGPPATVRYPLLKSASRVSWARCTPRDTWTP